MADAITNAQFAQSLFAPLVNQQRQRSDQMQQLALMALRRRQQLEDQQAQFNQQRDLANETTDRYIKVEDERSRRSEEHDKRAKEETAKNQAKQAYAEYARVAADTGQELKPFESFGSTADDVGNGIRQEMARIQGAQQDEAFKSLIEGYKGQLSSLRAMSSLSKSDYESATQKAAATFQPTFTDKDVWGKAVDHLLNGNESVGLKLVDPRDRAAFLAERNTGLQTLQILKQKSADYINAAEGVKLQGLEIAKAAFKNPKWAKAYSGAMASDPVASPSEAGPLDFGAEFGGKKTAVPPPKTSATETPAPTVTETFDSGGAPGVLNMLSNRIASVAPTAMTGGLNKVPDWLKQNAQYLPGTLNYIAGGRERFNQGEAERAATVNPSSPLSLTQPQSNSLRELILRSLFSAQPTLPPQ